MDVRFGSKVVDLYGPCYQASKVLSVKQSVTLYHKIFAHIIARADLTAMSRRLRT